jgi:hypothetical protein
VLGRDASILFNSNGREDSYPAKPGVMVYGEHYGFIIISNYNNVQKEFVFPTECKIDAIGVEGDTLKIFENGKKDFWRFDKNGILENSLDNSAIDLERSKANIYLENFNMFDVKPIIKNPINIKISKRASDSVILKDINVDTCYPIYPGVLLGEEHYGFIFIIDSKDCQKELFYPTQNKIDALGCDNGFYDDLKIYEEGKYFPWVFSYDGKLKSKASYNKYSRNDCSFINQDLDLGNEKEIISYVKKKNNKV